MAHCGTVELLQHRYQQAPPSIEVPAVGDAVVRVRVARGHDGVHGRHAGVALCNSAGRRHSPAPGQFGKRGFFSAAVCFTNWLSFGSAALTIVDEEDGTGAKHGLRLVRMSTVDVAGDAAFDRWLDSGLIASARVRTAQAHFFLGRNPYTI